MAPLLESFGFVRIHREHVVNLAHIRLLRLQADGRDWELKLEPPVNKVLPIARDRLAGLLWSLSNLAPSAGGFETRDEAVELGQNRSVCEERILRVGAQQLIEGELGISRKLLARRDRQAEIGETARRNGHHQGVDCDRTFLQVAESAGNPPTRG